MEQLLELGESPVRLALRPGSRLVTLAGHAWITQSNERRDVVLGRDQTLCLHKSATLLVDALKGRVSLRLTQPAAVPGRPGLVHRVLQAANPTAWRRNPRFAPTATEFSS